MRDLELSYGYADLGPPAISAIRRGKELAWEGDALVYAGEIEHAKATYGKAIDALLDGQRYDDAIKVSRRLIRVAPEAARARYTLAFLLIGAQRLTEAREATHEYVQACRAAGAESFAVPRLALLFHATADSRLRNDIATLLAGLGAEADGIRLMDDMAHEDPELSPTEGDLRARWERLLPIVLRQ